MGNSSGESPFARRPSWNSTGPRPFITMSKSFAAARAQSGPLRVRCWSFPGQSCPARARFRRSRGQFRQNESAFRLNAIRFSPNEFASGLNVCNFSKSDSLRCFGSARLYFARSDGPCESIGIFQGAPRPTTYNVLLPAPRMQGFAAYRRLVESTARPSAPLLTPASVFGP